LNALKKTHLVNEADLLASRIVKKETQISRPASAIESFIRLERLSKSYLEGGVKRMVLQDASLELKKGQIAAILGKSGSGKTTLLNLIGGIDRADAGDIFVDGQKLTALKDQELTLFRRAKIGFIFQFFNLIPTLTVWENVALPLELNGRLDKAGIRRAEELLAEVGLADRRRAFPDRLSGGEQQRVAIARALVHEPLVMLADEPTGNLDEDTGAHVLSLLKNLARQNATTLVLVTHSLEAAAIADLILHLREGKLVEEEQSFGQ
jgi:putative ABC transport system ATP-binding protein